MELQTQYMNAEVDHLYGVEATEDVEIAQRTLDERKLYKLIVDKISDFLKAEPYAGRPEAEIKSATVTVLCYFAYGYWGNNKVRSADTKTEGIIMKIKGKPYNLTEKLGIVKIDENTNDSTHISASRVARIAAPVAFYNRKTKVALNSPLRKKAFGMTPDGVKAAADFLQIHGYLLPLKMPHMTKQEKIACLGVNFFVHYVNARADVKEGVLRKFQNIMGIVDVDVVEVTEWIRINRGTATGSVSTELGVFFKAIDKEHEDKKAAAKANVAASTAPVDFNAIQNMFQRMISASQMPAAAATPAQSATSLGSGILFGSLPSSTSSQSSSSSSGL